MGDAPSMVELFEQIRRSWTDEQRTWFPGRVLSFDASTKMADIQPLVQMPAGQEMPTIVDVRVCFPGGVYWDLDTGTTSGETGIVLVGWRSWASWRRGGDPAVPEDDGLHELDYATFLPGLWDDTYAVSQQLPAGAKVVPSSDLRLGSPLATKAVVHEDLLSALDTLLGKLDDWAGTAHANWGAAATAWVAPSPLAVKPTIDLIRLAIGLGNYQSPTVKVEN